MPFDKDIDRLDRKNAELEARVAELEGKLERTEQALSISHRTTDNYRKALEEVATMIEPAVGRFSDGEPINPIGHAYDLIQSTLNP
jgi:septal ring factor EnvC (AmiA/AmiB activator)